MSNNELLKYASSLKAKKLLEEFLKEKSITEKATALGGVCELLEYEPGAQEIKRLLDGKHELNKGLPLQTIERFWSKHIKEFGNQRIRISKSGKSLTMIDIDVILSQIQQKLYYIHAKVVTDGKQ